MNTKPGNKYKLEDLIDINHFQDLQDRLNEIYSLPSAIIDNEGSILTATGWQDICKNFHRKNRECEKACIQSDKYILEHLNEANPAITYRCSHGLVDNATPIIIDGVHYGNFFTGQFFMEKPDLDFFRAQAKKYDFSEKPYLEAVKKVPVRTQEELNNYLFFIKGLIAIISESGLKNLKEIEARKQIQESERRYQSIIQTALDGFWLVDTQGHLVEINDAYCKMSGYSREELLKMSIADLEADESPDEIARNIQKVIKKGGDRFIRTHRRKDGSLFEVELSIQYHPENKGRFVCFLRDITDRKRYEESLREREELLNKSQEMASIGSFVWDMVNNKITWSSNMYAIYGYEEKSFSGDLLEVSEQLMHPDDTERSHREVMEMVEKTSAWDVEFRVIRPDGQERVIRSKGEVERDAEGNQVKSFGINQDITERKKADELKKKSEEQYRTILQTTIDGFLHIDRHGNLVEVNDSYCKMSGYSREELLKMTAADLETVEPSDEVEQKINEIVEKKTHRFQRQHRKKDGSIFDVEISAQYLPEEEGFVCFLRDITKTKEMESQLQQSQKMESIGILAGGIAHDFNNILSPIMLHAEMAMADLPPDDPLQNSMKEIFYAGERARDLVKQILTFARKRSEKKVPLKTSPIIKDALKFLRSTIPTTINIQFDFRSKKDTVLADTTQLNQIIINLCTNAAHAMREKGGLLEIILDNEDISPEKTNRFFNLTPGMYLKLSVRDNGTGISPGIIGRIFEPYYTTKKMGEGTGLGLATVHGIVKNYGGDITVESKVGEGTTFHVYLPLIDEEISGDGETRIEMQNGTERILLVDDEKAALKITQRMLERFGYKVTSTTNSLEALEVFRQNPETFDLVITDMTMPNMTGDTLAKEIMAVKPKMKVILCTGFSDKIDEEKAKKKGISSYVMKPIVMGELAKTIREVLDKAK